MLCSGRGGGRSWEGWVRGEGRALVINRYARHSEKLTEIYDVQIYGGKQKGRRRKNRKRASERHMEGGEETESQVYYPNEERGASDQ